MTTEILPGCEPYSHDGGPIGVLVLHGLTGNPTSMRPLAERLAGVGYTVELPRLPGHGTSIEDVLTTGWPDWSATALAAYDRLAQRCEHVGVVGLSMGGGLTAFVAEQRPSIGAAVFINAQVQPGTPEIIDGIDQFMAAGLQVIESGGESDVKKEGVSELAYGAWPLPCLKSLFDNLVDVHASLGTITAPCLVMTSREDHTVTSDNSDDIVAMVSGPVEHVWLEDSYHVATIDNDQAYVESATLEFFHRVFGA